MDVRKYWTMCRLHDWLYEYSDDPSVYREGYESHNELIRLANGRPEFVDMYHAWYEHAFNCGPRPAEPKMED